MKYDVECGMEQAIFRAEETKKQAADTIGKAENLIKQAHRIEQICDDIQHLHELSYIDNELFINHIKLLNEQETKIKSTTFGIYKNVFSALLWGGYRRQITAMMDDYCSQNRIVEGIIATADDDNLYIKLPLLAEKNYHTVVRNGRPMALSNYGFFTESLDAALMCIADDIPNFETKNISYLFVHSSERKHIIDNDNYSTKPITDIICSRIIGGDSAQSTSFFCCSAERDNIPEGTYITVTPDMYKIPDMDKILSFWKCKKYEK